MPNRRAMPLALALAYLGRLAWGAGGVAVTAFREWVADRCGGLAAALAFHALLALVPFLTVILVLAATVLGEGWTRRHLAPAILGWAGPHGTAVLRFLAVDLEDLQPETLLTVSLVALVSLVVGAAGFFNQMKDALATIWGVRREVGGLATKMGKKLLGLAYAAGSAVIVLAGLMGVVLGRPARPVAPALAAFVMLWALASFWLKAMVPVRLRWRLVLPWGAVVAGLHLLGRSVLAWWAGGQHPDSAVDVAAALMLLLLWFYYASMVFLFGAEMMRVQLQRTGQAPVVEGEP